MKESCQVVVLGDINLDWVVSGHLPFPFTELSENGVITWAGIDELPGGSGLNFARFVRQAGYSATLIGRVGGDPAGRFLTDWLITQGIRSGVTTDDTGSTGKALIVRDRNDIRLLVNNRDNANHRLSIEDVEAQREEIGACQLLYVSGYCVNQPNAPRFEASRRALKLARLSTAEPRPVIVFDVVPHRIYELHSFERFLEITRDVDILISEVSTMRRFLGMGRKSETVDGKLATETLEGVKAHYSRFVLRFGRSGCDTEVLWDSFSGQLMWRETGHSSARDKRGFGDLLAIGALRDFFGVLGAN